MKYFTLLIILAVLTGGVIGFLQSTGSHEEQDVNITINPRTPAFAYTTVDEKNQTGGIRLFETTTGITRRIYDFSLPTPGTFPVVSLGFRDSVFLDLGLPEQFRIDISKQTAETISEPNMHLPTLRSPSGRHLAFNRSRSGTMEGFMEETDLVIQSQDGTEWSIDSGSVGDIGIGMLTPFYWALDEQTLYAQRVHATEGDIVGLVAIDVQTMEQRRIQKIDELGISRYVFDEQGNVYGFAPIYLFGSEEEAQHTLYRISLSTGEATSFSFTSSSISDTFTVDPAGRYLAYGNGDDANAQNLWVYDFTTGEEKAVTENAVVFQVLPWKDGMLVFREENAIPPMRGSLVSYTVATDTRKLLVAGEDVYLSLIDWYPSP